MEGFWDISDFEAFMIIVGILLPFVLFSQLFCSLIRWRVDKTTLIRQRFIIYWSLLAIYAISVYVCLFLFKGKFFQYIYFLYWLIWAYYCIAILFGKKKEKRLNDDKDSSGIPTN